MRLRSNRTTEDLLALWSDHQLLLYNFSEFNIDGTGTKMDISGSSFSQKVSTGIKLDKWQDWPLWYDQLKIWCMRNEIWVEVDPEVCEAQPNNVKPTPPCRPIVFDAETRANFQVENALYTNELRLWKEKDQALKQLD